MPGAQGEAYAKQRVAQEVAVVAEVSSDYSAGELYGEETGKVIGVTENQ